jgi:hypothetical protein
MLLPANLVISLALSNFLPSIFRTEWNPEPIDASIPCIIAVSVNGSNRQLS